MVLTRNKCNNRAISSLHPPIGAIHVVNVGGGRVKGVDDRHLSAGRRKRHRGHDRLFFRSVLRPATFHRTTWATYGPQLSPHVLPILSRYPQVLHDHS